MCKLLQIFVALILLLSANLTKVSAQSLTSPDLVDFRAFTNHFIAPFNLIGKAPQGFEELVRFEIEYLPGQEAYELKYDKQGNVPVRGYVLVLTKSSSQTGRGRMIKFASCRIILSERSIKLSFTTKKFKSAYYIFEGQYFDTGIAYPERDSTRLEGVLTKMKKGVKTDEAKISLYPGIADVD